ncbi:hypothetical protein CAPTEDRAFT_173101 [Capitella teleta]|uniref:Proteasome maturation protein n=1 Tax=Capitella teleta TaxID=283909 RepID=R7UDA4_CAPTE|nr:hypothetical protein CAPTEDRAFT_173101 [Capitella teleta]|eukprot:ELU03934.1 hypothetical protein CAPTEDRAFT_173101 [Capitella teleta]
MSLGYPPLRPKPQVNQTQKPKYGPHELPNLMLDGFQSNQSELLQSHPLEYSEKNWRENKFNMDMALLRNAHGIQMPLHLQLERKSVPSNLRLPGMASSNLSQDILSGKIEDLDICDVINNPRDSEAMGDPHAIMERKLGLL